MSFGVARALYRLFLCSIGTDLLNFVTFCVAFESYMYVDLYSSDASSLSYKYAYNITNTEDINIENTQ